MAVSRNVVSTTTTADWKRTVMTAEKLRAVAIADPTNRVLDVTRNVWQLRDAAERLRARAGACTDAEAPSNGVLCGDRDVDWRPRLGSTASAWPDVNVDGFVRELLQDAILGLAESTKAATERSAVRVQTDVLAREWRAKKLRIVRGDPSGNCCRSLMTKRFR